jgi:hypothetical protein
LRDLADDWRFGGTLIADDAEVGQPREAFNIMLSMPRGTDPLAVQRAAREFAQVELADHKYVIVLHDHQARQVISMCQPRHRHGEWLKFVRLIDRRTPKHLSLHLIVDNYATHSHPDVQQWLARHLRFVMHFTPTSASLAEHG